ncbi:MAG TPA: ABC transporter ATP-binding protein [Planctomycetota bacterium]|nr:ABC transporter ATP-binding protein [Planctomycetota bacterium]
MITIDRFAKSYDRFVAVKELSLDIPKGEIFGFIGPNGAGKTTTFRFLSTLLEPTSGRATINGFDVVREVRDVRRHIGYMPDSFGVYNGMRVWEFLDFFAVAYGVARTQRSRLIHDCLALVDLHHKRNDLVNALSRGMKQRLCLAKTLVHDPPVLILDEPASGLDPRARVEMKELLKELRQMGKTIFISSHILSELADTCTSVAIVERGELLAAGSIDSILRALREHRDVEVVVLNDQPGAELFLSHHPKIASVTKDDGVLRFEFSGSDEELAVVSDELYARKHRPLWIRENRPDLEAIFMKVTKGRVQ